MCSQLTFLNAVLVWALEVGILAVSGDALNALVEVVLVGGTLLGLGALCIVNQKLVSQLLPMFTVYPLSTKCIEAVSK